MIKEIFRRKHFLPLFVISQSIALAFLLWVKLVKPEGNISVKFVLLLIFVVVHLVDMSLESEINFGRMVRSALIVAVAIYVTGLLNFKEASIPTGEASVYVTCFGICYLLFVTFLRGRGKNKKV